MTRTSLRRAIVPGIASLALALSACGAGNEADGAESDSELSGTLSGGGASSQEAAQSAWRAGFQSDNPDVTVNYDPTGSGGGRENFTSGGFAFAGSDSYLDDDEGELSAAKEQCAADPIEIPNYVSPIAVIHNVEGVDELKLTPAAIAGIFNDKITKWNDPAIAATNEGVELPDANITAVHRSDESGTTGNFTNYLSVVAEDEWTHGEVEEWPIKSGEGANGTSGVVSAVANGTNTIGYADASQAGDLGTVLVEVGDDFVGPTPEAAAKILEVSPRVEGRADSSLTFDLDYETDEAGAYPIVLTSYLMACPTYEDAKTADLVKGYLTYILSDAGQKKASESAGSAPLAESLAAEAQKLVDGIKGR